MALLVLGLPTSTYVHFGTSQALRIGSRHSACSSSCTAQCCRHGKPPVQARRHEQTSLPARSALAGRRYFHSRAFYVANRALHRLAANLWHQTPRGHPHDVPFAFNPQFNNTGLAGSLTAVHLEYVHIQALGGLRHARKDSPNTGWRNEGFRGYADYMQSEQFQDALETLIQMSRQKRLAMMCAEAVPWRCHRSLVADALSVRGIPVIEILSESSYRTHKLTPFAQVEGIRITYPPAQAKLL